MENQLIMPKMGENIERGFISRIAVAAGDHLTAGQLLLEVESDKSILEVTAEQSGVLSRVLVSEGEQVSPGQPLALFCSEQEEHQPGRPVPPEASVQKTVDSARQTQTEHAVDRPGNRRTGEPPYAGPAAFRMARELGIALERISGSAPGGRITREDVKEFLREKRGSKQSVRPLQFSAELPGATIPQQLNAVGKATARRMQAAWEQAPHAWVESRADVSAIEQERKHWNACDNSLQIGMTAVLLKALATTLRAFPEFNACFDAENQVLLLKEGIHLGLAVDTPRGLLVPVIREADQLSLGQLAEAVARLAEDGRNNRLTPEQLTGSGMTLSNLGGLGAERLFPIVNWPEIAILGCGMVRTEPVWNSQGFVPRRMLNLVLGFDHRVINGADAARFLNNLRQSLESPTLLALR